MFIAALFLSHRLPRCFHCLVMKYTPVFVATFCWFASSPFVVLWLMYGYCFLINWTTHPFYEVIKKGLKCTLRHFVNVVLTILRYLALRPPDSILLKLTFLSRRFTFTSYRSSSPHSQSFSSPLTFSTSSLQLRGRACAISGEVKEPTSSKRPQVLKAMLPSGESSMEPGLIILHMLEGPGQSQRATNVKKKRRKTPQSRLKKMIMMMTITITVTITIKIIIIFKKTSEIKKKY